MVDISVLYSLGQKITTCIIAHRPNRHQSMCDSCVLYSLGQKITTCIIEHRASSIVATKNCAISGPLLNEEQHHTLVLEFGQNISISFKSFRFGRMKLIACPNQSSATSTLFFDNLHFEHFDKSVYHESRLTLLSKCSKWRLSKNRGLVAGGWPKFKYSRMMMLFVK